MSKNSIMVLQPYWHAGTWVFDDDSKELDKEPFVCGIPAIIDDAVRDIPNAREGFRLLFSTGPFPGHTHKLQWRREESGGNWYHCPQLDAEGWLCPQLLKYFDKAPHELYAKAEPLDQANV